MIEGRCCGSGGGGICPFQLGIIYNIGDILQIGRSSLNRENYYALFVSHSGNCHYSTLGHDTGRYLTAES